jgi:hypothetical protein
MCLYVGFVPGLGIQVLSDTTLCHWTSRFWRFGGSWLFPSLRFKVSASKRRAPLCWIPDITCQKSWVLSDTALTWNLGVLLVSLRNFLVSGSWKDVIVCLYVGFVPGLGIHVLCDRMLNRWMSRSWRFGGSWFFHPQGSRCLLRNVGRLSAEYPTSPARNPEFSATLF